MEIDHCYLYHVCVYAYTMCLLCILLTIERLSLVVGYIRSNVVDLLRLQHYISFNFVTALGIFMKEWTKRNIIFTIWDNLFYRPPFGASLRFLWPILFFHSYCVLFANLYGNVSILQLLNDWTACNAIHELCFALLICLHFFLCTILSANKALRCFWT